MSMRSALPAIVVFTSLLVPAAGASGAGVPEPSCWVAAFGILAPVGGSPGGDVFWGFASSSQVDDAKGQWLHWPPATSAETPWGRLHRRDSFVGQVESADCARNGALLVTLQGSGLWNGAPGHVFQVTIHDRQDPAQSDFYRIVIVAPDLSTLVYTAEGDLAAGDVYSIDN